MWPNVSDRRVFLALISTSAAPRSASSWDTSRARKEAVQALRLGVHHGMFCLGCCWSLMLLMFAVGAGNVAWMLALCALVAVETNVSWGRRLSAPLGAVLLGWGATIILIQTAVGL